MSPPHDQERCPHAVPRPRWPLRSQRWCGFLLGWPESRHCPLLGTVPCVGDECRDLLCHCWSRPSCGIWSCGRLSPTLGDRGHGVSSRLVTCGVWGSSPRSQRGGDPVALVGTIPVTPIPLRLSPCSRCASVSPRDRAGGDSVAGAGWRGRARPRATRMAMHSPAQCWTSMCDLAQPCTSACEPRTALHKCAQVCGVSPGRSLAPLPDLVSPNEAQGCRSSRLEATVVLLPPRFSLRAVTGVTSPPWGHGVTVTGMPHLGAGCGSCAGGGWSLPHGHMSSSHGTVTVCCPPPHSQVSGSP